MRFVFNRMNLLIYLVKYLLSFLAFNSVTGFHRYVPALQMSIPNRNGIYEFELVLEPKLTMSRPLPNGRQAIFDYYPETKSWSQRDPNIFTECDNNSTVVKDSDDVLKKVEVLDNLVQHSGKHWRIATINGQSPGDVIVVPLGAKVSVKVKNRLASEAVTLHFHGLDKKNLWFTDGVAFVQQCPIAAGSEYEYNFIADTPGTHWYHGHLMNDRADGLLGGFVVKRPQEEYQDLNGQVLSVRREYYSILQDWATTSSSEQWLCHLHSTMKWVGYGFDELGSQEAGARKKCWTPKRTFDGSNIGGSIPLEAILVGDKGWYSQKDLRERPSRLPLTTYEILKGQNILLRLVNGGVSQGLIVWIENHDFFVVAADGAPVLAKKIDALVVFPGERYDILIKGLENPTKRHYRIIFETMEYYNWDWTIGSPQIGLANLKYEKGQYNEMNVDEVDFEHSKCSQESKCIILNCPFAQFPSLFNYTCIGAHLLESRNKIEDQHILEKTTFENGYQEVFMNMHFDNHVDGWMYKFPQGIPYYYHDRMNQVAKACDPGKCDRMHGDHWDHSCDCFVHYTFTLSDIVQLTVYNMGDGGSVGSGYSHPLHIHGTHFYLMKIGYAQYHPENGSIKAMNGDIPCIDTTERCLDLRWTDQSWLRGNVGGMQRNPSFRDTVNIPTGGYVVLRFRASNPGWWFAHCHLLLHNMGGTAFAFRVGTHEQVPQPPASYPHSCGIYEQSKMQRTEFGFSQAVCVYINKTTLVAVMTSILYTFSHLLT